MAKKAEVAARNRRLRNKNKREELRRLPVKALHSKQIHKLNNGDISDLTTLWLKEAATSGLDSSWERRLFQKLLWLDRRWILTAGRDRDYGRDRRGPGSDIVSDVYRMEPQVYALLKYLYRQGWITQNTPTHLRPATFSSVPYCPYPIEHMYPAGPVLDPGQIIQGAYEARANRGVEARPSPLDEVINVTDYLPENTMPTLPDS